MGVCVDVLVDGAPAHLGSLSYTADTTIAPGTAVEVPFGKRTANGVVIGPGDPTKATRDVIRIWGPRIDPADIEAAATIAARHLVTLPALAARFAPRHHKGDIPLTTPLAAPAGTVDLTGIGDIANRFLLRSPAVKPAELAAAAAHTLADVHHGQVLVVCPTKQLVTATVNQFPSGAARLDDDGAWAGFLAGTVPIGVTTRTGVLWSPANLAGIVVVEEDHPGHVEARTPHTNARDVAVLRAKLRGVPIVLTSSCPTGAGLGAGVKLFPVGALCRVETFESPRHLPGVVAGRASVDLRAGKTVAVITPSRTASRRCERCSTIRPCDTGSCHDPRCDHPIAAACTKCGTATTKIVGVDPIAAAAKLPDQVTVLAPGDSSRKTFDTVIVCAADAGLHRPGFEPERAVMNTLMHAAELVTEGGTLVAVCRDATHPMLAAARRRNHTDMVKLVWNRCKTDRLAPFGVVVKLTVASKRAPSTAAWPGTVLGPVRTSAGDWELIVKLDTSAMAAFATHLDRLRRNTKIRYQLT